MLTSLLLTALVPNVLAGTTQSYTFNIANKLVSPDGDSRQAIAVNDGIQGPLLTANKDDNFSITVNDNNSIGPPVMLKSTSIHWHGFFQHRYQDEDGVAFVSQCPITTGSSYTYTFPAAEQSGTYWYHSHLGTQYCDGLRGPIVVYDPNDPLKDLYDVDNADTVLTLADWYHTPSLQAFPYGSSRPVPPTPASHLYNGFGRQTNTSSPLGVTTVTQGKRYRFRLVNMACDAYYLFWIEGHQLTVIEADGVLHQPYIVDYLTIYEAQRYSFALTANQTVSNYWIRFAPNAPLINFLVPDLYQALFNNNINSAILRYSGASSSDPTGTALLPSGTTGLVESNLVPLQNPGAPTGTLTQYTLNIVLNPTTNEFSINGVVYQPPSLPVLLQILNGKVKAQDIMPAGSIYEVPKDTVVEITIPGGGIASPHPFHLHGHNFDVIKSANQLTTNLVNPPRRDVASIGGEGGELKFRFKADNPGPWILHCHIDWHLDAGLAIVFAERADEVASGLDSDLLNPDYTDLCPAYQSLAPGDL